MRMGGLVGNCGLPFPDTWEEYSAAVQLISRRPGVSQAEIRVAMRGARSRLDQSRVAARARRGHRRGDP